MPFIKELAADASSWNNNCALNNFAHYIIEALNNDAKLAIIKNRSMFQNLLQRFNTYYQTKFEWEDLRGFFRDTYPHPHDRELIFGPVLRNYYAEYAALFSKKEDLAENFLASFDAYFKNKYFNADIDEIYKTFITSNEEEYKKSIVEFENETVKGREVTAEMIDAFLKEQETTIRPYWLEHGHSYYISALGDFEKGIEFSSYDVLVLAKELDIPVEIYADEDYENAREHSKIKANEHDQDGLDVLKLHNSNKHWTRQVTLTQKDTDTEETQKAKTEEAKKIADDHKAYYAEDHAKGKLAILKDSHSEEEIKQEYKVEKQEGVSLYETALKAVVYQATPDHLRKAKISLPDSDSLKITANKTSKAAPGSGARNPAPSINSAIDRFLLRKNNGYFHDWSHKEIPIVNAKSQYEIQKKSRLPGKAHKVIASENSVSCKALADTQVAIETFNGLAEQRLYDVSNGIIVTIELPPSSDREKVRSYLKQFHDKKIDLAKLIVKIGSETTSLENRTEINNYFKEHRLEYKPKTPDEAHSEEIKFEILPDKPDVKASPTSGPKMG